MSLVIFYSHKWRKKLEIIFLLFPFFKQHQNGPHLSSDDGTLKRKDICLVRQMHFGTLDYKSLAFKPTFLFSTAEE